ncbi:MAG: protease SohB [Gammaproteobacteria bacterium]|nr:protease SohB [Gammaproteobacteria bacterium]
MEFLIELSLFLVKAIIIVVAIVIVLSMLFRGVGRSRQSGHDKHGWIEVQKISELHDSFRDVFNQARVGRHVFMKKKQTEAKAKRKEEKKTAKTQKKESSDEKESSSTETTETLEKEQKRKLYVLNFQGDVEASQVEALRNEVTAVLLDASDKDEILVGVQSPGGLVHAYGLAASQLLRIKQAGIRLTVAVDQVAASGGYMMAAVADRIIAAPFALLGSVGVVAEVPNFNRLLEKNQIDYEVITAGEHKRTLTVFGKNTDEHRAKFKDEIEDVHKQFREFVTEHRPVVEDDTVKTGEAWYGQRALANKLIDEIQTSDQYIMNAAKDSDVYKVTWMVSRTPIEKFAEKFNALVTKLRDPLGHLRQTESRYRI